MHGNKYKFGRLYRQIIQTSSKIEACRINIPLIKKDSTLLYAMQNVTIIYRYISSNHLYTNFLADDSVNTSLDNDILAPYLGSAWNGKSGPMGPHICQIV
jgi:hypothetical protein